MTAVGIWTTTCSACGRTVFMSGHLRDNNNAALCIDCSPDVCFECLCNRGWHDITYRDGEEIATWVDCPVCRKHKA